MIDDSNAPIIPLHQTRRPKTAAERQRAYRQRRRQQRQIVPAAVLPDVPADVLPNDPPVTPAVEFPVTASVTPATSAIALPVTDNVTPVTESYRHVTGGRPLSSYSLIAAALALGGVGVTMNGWFARSLGSTELAGWLFLAVGVAADLVALAMPSTAAQLWQARQRATAAAAWLVWSMTFLFAVTAGIGSLPSTSPT
ncbi:hypothetical protein ABIF70_005223 [Bradyrhizobium japonicum]